MKQEMRKHSVWAIVAAAGSGSRMGQATPKQFLHWRGEPLYLASARALARCPHIAGIVFVFPPAFLAREIERLKTLSHTLGAPWRVAAGGARRQDSTRLGLELVPIDCEIALVHDAARPFLTPELVARMVESMREGVYSAAPCVPVSDTIKLTNGGKPLLAERTLPRELLAAVQTPQAFACRALRAAHANALKNNIAATDDCALMEFMGFKTLLVEGERDNKKITTPEDLALLKEQTNFSHISGFGYDVHKYGGPRPLKICGVAIPCDCGIYAHSDGDVALHALADAILGCAGAGDIGRLFPDSSPEWENASSAIFLDEALDLARRADIEIIHADITIAAQKPKLAGHAVEIRANLARLLNLPQNSIGFKATTEEGLGFTGRGEGIKAYALVSARKAL